MIVFIVVVSVGVAGILSVMTLTTRQSADPLPRKQALAIADALLEEIELQPWTYCDPDDANAATAQDATVGDPKGCATLSEALGPEPGEGRYSVAAPFDNVNDYNGFDSAASGGIRDLTGAAVPALAGYRATVAVANAVLGGAPALQITVTVTGPGNTSVALDGYRTFYAPRT